MLTLSAANQSNILNRAQNPAIIVEFPNLSLVFTNDWEHATGIPALKDVSDITYEISPFGGVASWSDVTVTLSPEQFDNQYIKDNEFTYETMTIVAKYGTDADIPLWGGKVDSWSYEAGVITITGAGSHTLEGNELPIKQLNATNYSTYLIPDNQRNKWIPFTIGAPYRPVSIQASVGEVSRYHVNAAVTGHDGIQTFDPDSTTYLAYLYNRGAARWLNEFGWAARTGAEATGGYIDLPDGDDVQFILLDVLPVSAEWSDGATGTNPENAIDRNTATYAELDNPAADNQTAGEDWRGRMPDLNFGGGHFVTNMYYYGKVEKEQFLNHGGRTAERFNWGFEMVPGTDPVDNENDDIIPTGSATVNTFNNVDGSDGITDTELTTSFYALKLSNNNDDATGNNVDFPVDKLSGLFMNIKCIEEDDNDATDDSDYFRIYWAGCSLLMWVGIRSYTEMSLDCTGYEDDGSGTYTGSANSLIETPSDIVEFIMSEIFSFTFATGTVSAARTDYGNFIGAGQILDKVELYDVLQDMCFEWRMFLWTDREGNWKMRRWDETVTADKTFTQDAGDFAGDEIHVITQSPSENLINQFCINWGWSANERNYGNQIVNDESSGGSLGTWLTDSQSDYNITRKRTFNARWINDENSAISWGHYLIYMFADRRLMCTWETGWAGAEMELGDRVKLDHTDVTEVTDESTTIFEIYKMTIKPFEGRFIFDGIQVDLTHSALTDPT